MLIEISEIIKSKDRYLAALIENIDKMIFIDPYTVIFKGRIIAERIVKIIISDEDLMQVGELNQRDKINLLASEGLLKDEIYKALHTLRIFGNKAIHDELDGAFESALMVYRLLYKVLSWYVTVYVKYDYEIRKYVEPNIIEIMNIGGKYAYV